MRSLLITTVLSLFFISSFAQYRVKEVTSVLLPDSLQTGMREISSLAITKNKLVLLPENRDDRFRNQTKGIYTVPLHSITRQLKTKTNKQAVPYNYQPLIGIESIQKQIPHYQGLEAISIARKSFVITVETGEESDYHHLIKGVIRRGQFIIDTTHIIALKKPKLANNTVVFNAGYESVLHFQKSLITLHEFNYFPQNSALQFDNRLRSTAPITITEPIPFRVTDISSWHKNQIIATNFFFPLKAEAVYQQHLLPQHDSLILQRKPYARLLIFDINKNKMTVNASIELPKEWWQNNWEGLTKWRQGLLMVNDKFANPGQKTELIYISLEKP